jgi:phosphate transport system substrate-binding protein
MTMRPRLQSCLLIVIATASVCAQNLDNLPSYKPGPAVSGKLIAWGNPEQKPVWDRWREGFSKYHPNVKFEDNLKSSATISGALFTGTANVGVAGREIMPLEALAFRNIFVHDVYQVVTGSGTYDTSQQTPALGVFVNRDNPLSNLTMKQLDAIFGREHRRGAPANIRTWGQLGLTGEWADKPIHIYGHVIEAPATAYFFALMTFNGSTKWSCDLHEMEPGRKADGSVLSGGARIADAVGNDRYAIGYTSFDNRTALIKSVALAPADNGPYIEGTRENVANRTYPLTRSIYIFVNRDPAKGFDPTVKEFLRYVLSREGQQAVSDGKYLPLTAEVLRIELQKLD